LANPSTGQKTILFEYIGGLHPSQRWLLSYPPNGYQFVVRDLPWDHISDNFIKNSSYAHILTSRGPLRLLPLPLFKSYLDGKFYNAVRNTSNLFGVYAYNHLPFVNKPFVVFTEWIHIVTGFNISNLYRFRSVVEKRLASEECKAVIVWSEVAKKAIISNLDTSKFRSKIVVIPPAVPANTKPKHKYSDKVKILFVGQGSTNDRNEFYFKGGLELLQAFRILNERYRNLELVIRDFVPPELHYLFSAKTNVRVYQKRVPFSVLEDEYLSSDIFVLPSYAAHNLVIPEAMSYGLPVVTTDAYNNIEWVQHGTNGFVIKTDHILPYYSKYYMPPRADKALFERFRNIIFSPKPEIVRQIVSIIESLIVDDSLRKKMAQKAKEEVEKGKFSITSRNDRLAQIFDQFD